MVYTKDQNLIINNLNTNIDEQNIHLNNHEKVINSIWNKSNSKLLITTEENNLKRFVVIDFNNLSYINPNLTNDTIKYFWSLNNDDVIYSLQKKEYFYQI